MIRRNPFAIVASALASLFHGKPKKTVIQAQLRDDTDAPAPRQRRHTKHGRTSEVWRHKNRPRRRKLLGQTWLRTITRADHPAVTVRKRWVAACTKRLAEGRPLISFPSFRKKARVAS